MLLLLRRGCCVVLRAGAAGRTQIDDEQAWGRRHTASDRTGSGVAVSDDSDGDAPWSGKLMSDGDGDKRRQWRWQWRYALAMANRDGNGDTRWRWRTAMAMAIRDGDGEPRWQWRWRQRGQLRNDCDANANAVASATQCWSR